MDSEHKSTAAPWAARINFGQRREAQGCHAPRPWDKKQGLVIWEGERRLSLSATQATSLLDCLRADDSWEQDRIVVGEPVTQIALPKRKGDPVPELQTVLVNQMQLTPRRTETLVRLLEKHEAQSTAHQCPSSCDLPARQFVLGAQPHSLAFLGTTRSKSICLSAKH